MQVAPNYAYIIWDVLTIFSSCRITLSCCVLYMPAKNCPASYMYLNPTVKGNLLLRGNIDFRLQSISITSLFKVLSFSHDKFTLQVL